MYLSGIKIHHDIARVQWMVLRNVKTSQEDKTGKLETKYVDRFSLCIAKCNNI